MNTKVVYIETTNTTVTNTVTTTNIFQTSIDGGTLGTTNKLRWDMQGIVSFDTTNFVTIGLVYGGSTVATCVVGTGVTTSNLATKGLRVVAELSGDGSVSSQFGTIHSYLGVTRDQDASVPIGHGAAGVASGSAQNFTVNVKWSAGSTYNILTHSHSTLELLGYNEPALITEVDDDVIGIIYMGSKLNNLNYILRKSVYFYAPLENDLIFYGYGSCSFTRTSATTATWRDGATHAVAANKPRFEYSGDTYLGLAINTATETLSYSTSNVLNDSNTIIWLENAVVKSTLTHSNPFNSSGVYIGTSGVHIRQIVKLNKVATTAEVSLIGSVLTG